MAKTKYYAVRIGRTPGIYETWKECQDQTNGFPNSRYKSFNSKEEAENFLIQDIEDNLRPNDTAESSLDYDDLINKDLDDGYVVAFTDGSFDGTTKTSSYGIVLIPPRNANSTSIVEVASKVSTTRFTSSNNIVGEVFGVINACDWCLKNDLDKVSIYCDLQGLHEWANGEWKAKTDITKFYVSKIEELKLMLDIKFTWVRGHSNIQYNEQADILAKNALVGSRIFKSGANYFSGVVQNEKDVEELLGQLNDVVDYTKTEPIYVNNENGKKTTLEYQKEKVHITYFKRNRSILVQGKPGFIFSYLLSFYSEKLDVFNMVTTYSNAYESTIKKERVEEEFLKLNIPGNYPNSIQQLVKQSISSLHIKNIDDYDYGHYTVPAYRALEGHLRYLCEEAGFHLSERFNLGGSFGLDKTTGEHYITNEILKNSSYKDELEKCYNVYYNNRHPLLHTGEIGIADTTLLIPTMDEAKDRINEVLDLIQF